MIDLAWPWVLLLAPLPLLLRAVLPPARAPTAALRVPFFDPVGDAAITPDHPPTGGLTRLLAAAVWLLLLLTAAGPCWQGEALSLPVSGRDLLLAVDISASMEQPDLDQGGHQRTRLSAVKEVARQFIEQREGDRLGLILFGSRAYLQTPLTFDRTTVGTLLAEARIGLAGKETAIGDAIGLAIKHLRRKPAPDGPEPTAAPAATQRVLILLTDGANTAGETDPGRAARFAASYGIRIHTVGIGAQRPRGGSRRVGERPVNPAAGLDEETLRFIAATTGGVYFRATDVAGLERVYAEIDRLEPGLSDQRLLRPITTLFPWPLGLALLLSALLGLRVLHR